MAKITALDIADQLTGDEHLPIVQGADTKRVTMGAFRDLITPFLQYWYKGDAGDTGASDNTYVSRALLRASDITRKTASLVGDNFAPDGRFNYETRNGPYVDDDGLTTLVPEGDAAGAWVRQQAAGLVVRGVVAKDAQARFDELEVVMPFAVGDSPEIILAKGQAAIDFAPAGARVVIPKGDWLCATTAFSTSWLIAKRLNLRVDGRVRMTEGGRRDDPPTLLRVSGNNVTIEGNGTLQGPGTFDGVNVPQSETFPRIVDVTGRNFTMRGINMIDPPKVGLFLRSALNARIVQNQFMGGPTGYLGVGHMAVRTEGGSGHRLSENEFGINDAGGKTSQCIFSGGPLGATNNLTITDNRATAWEKLSYLYGDRHRVAFNEIYDCLRTDVMRIHGHYCTVEGNFGRDVLGVCTAYDAHDLTIIRNRFTGIRQTAAVVQRDSTTNYAGGFDNIQIAGNSFKADPASGNKVSGIQLYLEGPNSANSIEIVDNEVSVFADDNDEALIRVAGVGGCTPRQVRINRNRLSNCINAIIVRACSGYEIRENNIDSTAGNPVVISDSADGLIVGNRGLGSIGVVGIAGIQPTDTFYGNRWTADQAELTAIMKAGTNNVYLELPAWVAPEAAFSVEPDNDPARSSIGPNGTVRFGRLGPNLIIAHPSGNPAISDQSYRIRAEM